MAGTVFYSGNNGEGVRYAKDYADWPLNLDDWKGKNCSTENIYPDTGGKPITTAAGWSRGRLGPIYYLSRASNNPKRLDALRHIILYDPGSLDQMTGKGQCDDDYDVDGLLNAWLTRNKDNRLTILSGYSSLDASSGTLFNGIRSKYMTSMLGVPSLAANRAWTCVVESNGVPYSHSDTLRVLAYMMKNGPWNSCPRGFYGFRPGTQPYANRVVMANTQPSLAYLIGADVKRRWISSNGVFDCLKARTGKVDLLMSHVLLMFPFSNEPASCDVALPTPDPVDPSGPALPGPTASGPSSNGQVTLAQGPVAPAGFRYAISLASFPAGKAVSVSCRDTADPGGFYTFSLTTDGAGAASTANQCYSGDGPDHWVVADGVESNHVTWGGGQVPSPPTTPPPVAPTQAEQQGTLGANTFTNPYNASGIGVKIQPYQSVEVSCKVYAPQIASANPDGYWYRIASAPWNNAYYAVANTFWNGDVPGQKPYTHNTDFAVPNC